MVTPAHDPASSAAPDAGFVGRTKERAAATELLRLARSGTPRSLLIRGEAGIGKSTFLDVVVHDAARQGFRTVVARADRVDGGVPHAALRLAFEGRLTDETDPSLVASTTALHAALSRRPVPTARAEITDVLQRVLEGWAFRSPVLLALDDLHHADEQTTSLMIELMRRTRRHRVLLVAAMQVTPVLGEAPARALEALAGAGLVEVIDLSPLDDSDVGELVRHRTNHPVSPALVRLLQERTGGTPFFTIELLDLLMRTDSLTAGSTRTDDPRGLADPILPTRVQTAVLHRVFELGPDARAVAVSAAVLGRVPADGLDVLARVCGLGARPTRVAFAALVTAGVLVPDARDHLFVHAIVRDAVYDDIGPAARRRLHGRAAEALGATRRAGTTDVVEVAAHLLDATTGRDAAAAATFVAAGESLADSSPGEAAGWYRAALARLGPHDRNVGPTQLALARVLDLSGSHDEAARIAAAALESTTGEAERSRAVSQLAMALVNAGARDRAVDVLQAEMGRRGRIEPELALHLAQSLVGADRHDETVALVAAARRDGDDRVRVLADVVEVRASMASGDFAGAERLLASLRSRLDTLPGPVRMPVLFSLSVSSAMSFDPAEALSIIEGVPNGSPRAEWFGAVGAWARCRQGRFQDIAPPLDAVRRDLGHDAVAGVRLAAVLWAGVERADQGVAALVASMDDVAIPEFTSAVDVAVSMFHRSQGDHARAQSIVERAIEREGRRRQVDLSALALAAGVDAALDRGDTAGAAGLEERLWLLADRRSVAITMSCLLARAAVRRDADMARAAHDHAVRHGLAADAGRALGMIGSLNDDPIALATAYRDLGATGAVWRQRGVARDMRRLGHRVPHGATRPDELSPVELEVVSHVVAGLTNRQVADRMSLSPKTVEVYLSRIYDKTGSRSRVELAVAAHDGSLGPSSS